MIFNFLIFQVGHYPNSWGFRYVEH